MLFIKGVLNENKDYFNSLKQDFSFKTIMAEIQETTEDLEDKLQKLSLKRFCREKAEKYLASVTEKLHNHYIVLVSFLNKKQVNTIVDDKESKLLKSELELSLILK